MFGSGVGKNPAAARSVCTEEKTNRHNYFSILWVYTLLLQ